MVTVGLLWSRHQFLSCPWTHQGFKSGHSLSGPLQIAWFRLSSADFLVGQAAVMHVYLTSSAYDYVFLLCLAQVILEVPSRPGLTTQRIEAACIEGYPQLQTVKYSRFCHTAALELTAFPNEWFWVFHKIVGFSVLTDKDSYILFFLYLLLSW